MEPPDPPRTFTSAEVMRRTGLSRQVLYQYTAMGLIRALEPERKGQRRYDASVFSRLALIRELNESGYTLQEIKEIFFARR